MSDLQLKRGDTLKFGSRALTRKADGSVSPPENFAAWAIAAQLRFRGNLVAALVAKIEDAAAGTFTLSAPLGTQGWPVAELLLDIQYTTDAGQVISTPTMTVRILEDITR